MDRYLSTMKHDSREQVFKRALFLMLVFCLQSGEMIRTHGREKRHGRSSIFGFSKEQLHGTTKAIRINTFKDMCERQAAFKKEKKEFSTVRFSSCNLKINFAILVFLKWFSVTFDGSYIWWHLMAITFSALNNKNRRFFYNQKKEAIIVRLSLSPLKMKD